MMVDDAGRSGGLGEKKKEGADAQCVGT